MSTQPSPPPAAVWIVRTLEEAGYETWTVGGAIRDALLGLPSGDWDFATRASPAEVRRIFRRTVPIGVEHGTVGVLARDGTLYEVTTFRRDVETDGRHAIVAFADTLEEDLARRDFTINAIAWHPLRQKLCDPFGGVADLQGRRVRTVGEPHARFREDYLRILRALRFAGHFDFEIADETWRSLRDLVERVAGLSAERVREELVKVLDADVDPRRALDLYARSGALAVLYPELDALRAPSAGGGDAPGPAPDAWARAAAAAAALPRGRPFLRLAALLRPLEPAAAAALLVRLRLSNATVDEVARLAAAAPLPAPDAADASYRRWLSEHGPARVAALARLDLAEAKADAGWGGEPRCAAVVASWRRARAVRAEAPPLAVSDLALDGRGLISLGLSPGPDFGRILDDLLAWVLEDPSRNETSTLQERVLSMTGAERGE